MQGQRSTNSVPMTVPQPGISSHPTHFCDTFSHTPHFTDMSRFVAYVRGSCGTREKARAFALQMLLMLERFVELFVSDPQDHDLRARVTTLRSTPWDSDYRHGPLMPSPSSLSSSTTSTMGYSLSSLKTSASFTRLPLAAIQPDLTNRHAIRAPSVVPSGHPHSQQVPNPQLSGRIGCGRRELGLGF
ncbi:uncharacterized protein EI90DRAFT_3071075 [Cantharellus anzutake]|uniref:uncharacterized protein n=1 Tax=Cantharellus anzutake TaxID=1750568 RepID=UPI001906E1B5|nr:uncharacterized protein EI90DRAFT_3071075 [Cantharellus anzutake]KAF8325994.1 hypothetical protein EI90DRAFT_3071075 [Cantharellus anzutake]